MQARNLVAARDVNLPVHKLRAERLEEAGGKALPSNLLQLIVEPADEPHVAVKGANRRAAVGEEVVPAEVGLGVPRVRRRLGDVVHDVGAGIGAKRALGDDSGPLGGAALRERGEVGGRFGGLERGANGVHFRIGVRAGDEDFQIQRLRARLRDEREFARAGLIAFRGGELAHVRVASDTDDEAVRAVAKDGELELLCRLGLYRAVVRAEHHACAADEAQCLLARPNVQRAREDALAADGFEAGQFQHTRVARRVGQHDIVAMDVEAAILGLRAGQWALLIRARVSEIFGSRPARPNLRLEGQLALDFRRRRPLDALLSLAEFEEVS